MFGIKKKGCYIVALISAIIGIVVLALKVCKVFPDDTLYTLISLVFLLLGFAIYLRPALKTIKVIQATNQQYRTALYTIITKDSSKNKIDLSELVFEEKEIDGTSRMTYTSIKTQEVFIFDTLTLKEAQVIALSLLRDFAMIVYGVSETNKKKIVKASVPSFDIKFKYLNGEEMNYPLIRDYHYNKNV